MENMLHIGAKKETIVEAKRALLELLATKADPQPLTKAVEVFGNICQVTNTTVQYCTFTEKGVRRGRRTKN